MEKMKRLAAFAFIASMGFFLGIVANLVFSEALPLLIQLFPSIIGMSWIKWGLMGSLLSVAICIIYAYIS